MPEIPKPPFKSRDELTDYAVEAVKLIHIGYKVGLPDIELQSFMASSFKMFAGEYHRLVMEGKIPPEEQYRFCEEKK